MRAGLFLRCITKEIVTATVAEAAILQKVLDPSVRPSELASLAPDATLVVKQLTVPQTKAILELFSCHGVRHETLMSNCLWKIFKADAFTASTTLDKAALWRQLAICTATAFRVMCLEGLLHDPQLLTIGLGRCVECAGAFPLGSVADVYEGIRLFDRQFFSASEAALYANEAPDDSLFKKNADEEPNRVLSSQPNVLDVLCGELEARLESMATDGFGDYSPEDVVRLVHSLTAAGLVHSSTLSTLRVLLDNTKMSCVSILSVLKSLHGVHMRVIDVLNHDEGDATLKSERSALVQTLSAKLLAHNSLGSNGRDPQLILGFRQLFEKFPSLSEDAPQLWNAVRGVRVAHKHVMELQAKKQHRPGSGLFDQRYAVKVKPVMKDRSEVEQHVPPQFKTWRGPNIHNNRHKASSTPRRIGFGTRRISKNYLRAKRKKFTPSLY